MHCNKNTSNVQIACKIWETIWTMTIWSFAFVQSHRTFLLVMPHLQRETEQGERWRGSNPANGKLLVSHPLIPSFRWVLFIFIISYLFIHLFLHAAPCWRFKVKLTRVCRPTCSLPLQHSGVWFWSSGSLIEFHFFFFYPAPSAQFHPNDLLPRIQSLKWEIPQCYAWNVLHFKFLVLTQRRSF